MGARALAFSLMLLLSAACDRGAGGGEILEAAGSPAGVEAPAEATTQEKKKPAERAPRGKNERPLPAFEGITLAGDRVSSSGLIGRRLLLFFFDPSSKEAGPPAEAVAAVSGLRGKHNFDVVGVGVSSGRKQLESFVDAHGFDFPVIDDSSGSISRKLRLRYPAALVGVDGEGYVSFGMTHFSAEGDDPAGAAESQLREQLRLPAIGSSLEPMLGEKPKAPDFETVTLHGKTFDSRELRGRGAVLIFFLHTCPHCHRALESMRRDLDSLPEGQRPRLLGVSLSDRVAEVRAGLQEGGLDFFEVLLDPDNEIREAYGATGGTPDIFLIDAEGRVAARVRGWRDERDPPLMRMRLARLGGAPVPMLLHHSGYSGNEFCGVCHESQLDTYELTGHSWAYDTLVKHGAERDGECVGCHVVGFGQAGGFEIGSGTDYLEDVGCESCHGRGGPHLSPDFVKDHDYPSACVSCHDPQHSLGFDYATFHPKISHAANLQLLDLSLEGKRRLLAERSKLRTALLPEDSRYVGSDACQSCHAAEFETWSKSPHASSLQSLAAQGKTGSGECLQCHTTALGRPGGFPSGGVAASHPDLARVGCESCHGPGEAHVAEDAAKVGTIVSLGDKCDSCVILQICGSCHDDANDPAFEFEVQEKIDAQRHGTTEPGTGRKKDAQARLSGPSRVGLLETAFRTLDDRGMPNPGTDRASLLETGRPAWKGR